MEGISPSPQSPRVDANGPKGAEATLADRLNYHDLPRPFKNPHFVSRLSVRTASTSTTGVKKNAKQILTLERERVSGGDGFLSAMQVGQKLRGEPIDTGGKKKKGSAAEAGTGPVKKGNIANLMRGRKKAGRPPAGASGVSTPMDVEGGVSGATTPAREESPDEEEGGEGKAVLTGLEGVPRKEVFTYHTPAAPPSLLPAKKYCDITGLAAAYTDPRTKLRYKGLELWHVVRNLGPGADQAYLALRGAQTSLK
ncbi:uncharacterized protein MKK02DRAFT_39786 [Dioszegia hungarica]|uniref:Vps72/YL1 C-terminal domain-containing protein n=1 Tax=Dioszegia hungarica TaxID=4972 RepID=A0AA38HFN6_9TREE|nr:uncharacterized protein MKK02DRAFT_39786 [Dioszegia hungarica]KAI9639486.1 hypothetical protein MKK02DRAFT_39786 [Dioszegia hungarica]